MGTHIYPFFIEAKQFIAPMDPPANKISTQQLGKLIDKIWPKHKEKGKKITVKHFLEFYISRRTIYRYVDRVETRGTTDQKKGSGGHHRKMTYIKELKVPKKFYYNCGVSRRRMTIKLDVSTICVGRVLKKYWIKFWLNKNATVHSRAYEVPKI